MGGLRMQLTCTTSRRARAHHDAAWPARLGGVRISAAATRQHPRHGRASKRGNAAQIVHAAPAGGDQDGEFSEGQTGNSSSSSCGVRDVPHSMQGPCCMRHILLQHVHSCASDLEDQAQCNHDQCTHRMATLEQQVILETADSTREWPSAPLTSKNLPMCTCTVR